MRSWAAPPLSADLAQRLGPARPLSLYRERTGQAETTLTSGTARLYVCGITPYDATHIGHAATYVSFDLMVRAWRAAGVTVQYVQNITDIDDPLLERAAATGDDWQALAARETDLFRDDMQALSVIPPDVYVRLGEAEGWGRQPFWTHFDGYLIRTVDGQLRLQALAGGDVRYGGVYDLLAVGRNRATTHAQALRSSRERSAVGGVGISGVSASIRGFEAE